MAPLKVVLVLAALVGAAQCAAPTGFVLPAPAAYGLRSPAIIPRSTSTLGRPATMLSAKKGGLGGFFSSIAEKFEVKTPEFEFKGTNTIVKKEEDTKEATSKAKPREPLRPSENTKSVETVAAASKKKTEKKLTEAVSSPKKEAAEKIRASVKSSRPDQVPQGTVLFSTGGKSKPIRSSTATDERPGSQKAYLFTEEDVRARQERDATAKQELETKREKAKAKKDAEFAVRQEMSGTQRQPLQPKGKRPGSTTTLERLPEPKDPSLPWLERYLPAMWNAVPENQSLDWYTDMTAAIAEDARAAKVNIAEKETEAKLPSQRTGSMTFPGPSRTQASPPAKLELPKAKLQALEVNKKQWNV